METNESIAKAYKEMWDKIPNTIPNTPQYLKYNQSDWFVIIDYNLISLTKEQVIAANDHYLGWIGHVNDIDCYLIKPFNP